jgi:hypothetical protein
MIAFIDDHREAHGVQPICKVLPIAPSTYHAHVAKRPDPARLSARARRDAAMKIDIRRVFEENFRVYSVRKVWRQLKREGFDVARCTVSRLTRHMGLQGVIRGKTVKPRSATRPRHARWITSTAGSRWRAFSCLFKRLIAAIVPWMGLIPSPVSSVGFVSAPPMSPVGFVAAVLSRGLILRRYHAVGIAPSIDVDVIAVAARPTTNLLHQTIGVAHGSGAKVSSECCSSDCDYHLEPPYLPVNERSSIVEVPRLIICTSGVTASEWDIHPPLMGLAATRAGRHVHCFAAPWEASLTGLQNEKLPQPGGLGQFAKVTDKLPARGEWAGLSTLFSLH